MDGEPCGAVLSSPPPPAEGGQVLASSGTPSKLPLIARGEESSEQRSMLERGALRSDDTAAPS